MIIKSFGGNPFGLDYTAFILNGEDVSLPTVKAITARRIGAHPIVSGIERTGRYIPLGIKIEGSSLSILREQLMRWLDPEDETPKKLAATDDDSSNERYLHCICESLQPKRVGKSIISRLYVALLRVDKDVRWQSESLVTETSWNVTASGQTRMVNNQGGDEAYPIIKVKPTSNKTAGNGFTKRRFVPVLWNNTAAVTNYPICIGPLDLSTFAQADGDDVRVYVNGVEVDRWLGGTLVSNVKVWLNLDFDTRATTEVGVATGTGAITEIQCQQDIADFPSSGLLLIENELFTYTGKSNVDRTFTGVTRAAKDTTAANHVVGTTIYWIQHEVWLYYGDSSLTAPSTDDTYKPVFDLDASTNTVWDYDSTQSKCDGFGEDGVNRPGAWTAATATDSEANFGSRWKSTADHQTDASPWTDLGERHTTFGNYNANKRYVWNLYNPCGISQASFADGECAAVKGTNVPSYVTKEVRLVSSEDKSTWTTQGTVTITQTEDCDPVAPPALPSAWQSWSASSVSMSGYYVGFYGILELGSSSAYQGKVWVECADIVVTLNSTYTPTINATILGNEQDAYQLTATITNTTTGESVPLDFTLELNEQLEIDTDQKTVTYLVDNSGQLSALTVDGGVRKKWLPLDPGSNTLRYDETGVQGVTVDVSCRKRDYV